MRRTASFLILETVAFLAVEDTFFCGGLASIPYEPFHFLPVFHPLHCAARKTAENGTLTNHATGRVTKRPAVFNLDATGDEHLPLISKTRPLTRGSTGLSSIKSLSKIPSIRSPRNRASPAAYSPVRCASVPG
ncbi:hypothetical protein CCHOA_11525 [Corynebacterium choanae]|uniref:Uncharacterized protein n=1 Tax=Corynebacterium choanae TaxID=1862358 RepID=A0A3G6J9K6_9CORY|nr:hypothetical protein CCHOA_11525 [Corynebacterium choanae]